MLILTRKIGEKIIIGDDVVLSVVETSKGVVKLGIEAPKDVVILRQEVYDRVCEENIASAQGSGSGLFQAVDIMKKVAEKNKSKKC